MTQPQELTVGKIFTQDDYIIPLYQRNYAWEQAQVTQLIRDIWDFKETGANYYIGSLIVHSRESGNEIVYETIDGQQRLTTLNILLSVLKNVFNIKVDYRHESKLKFDSRVVSSDTLKLLADHGKTDNKYRFNTKMEQAYVDMTKELKQLARNKDDVKDFAEYLFDKVKILRVEVPRDTDLNHYFEIMNNRGEQLEKHEILKAEFLSHLKDDPDSSNAFAQVWDACSNMERYMVLGFRKELRNLLFEANNSTWDYLPKSFKEIKNKIKEYSKDKSQRKTEGSFLDLINTINSSVILEPDDIEDGNTRFNSVINFPNFLLQVLRVFTFHRGDEEDIIPLDDKRLIQTFKEEIKKSDDKAQFARDFVYELLRARFMFDKYVIKREFTQEGDNWSLLSIKISNKNTFYYKNTFGDENKNRQVLMLLAMFHVSFPQIIYKHWLSAVLYFLLSIDQRFEVDTDDYIYYLENLSRAFYFDRFGEKELDYFKIIFENNSKPESSMINVDKYLHQGTDVQNFIFNRLDYLIWKNKVVEEKQQFDIDNIKKFEFSFRSSVEHYYPQNPKPGADLKFDVRPEKRDQFGNLCLISGSKNSELRNYSPLAKAEHYAKSSTIESLKQRLMMKQKDSWDEAAIEAHQNEMIALLEG